MSQSFEQEITIINKLGIHARPAAMIVRLANKFKSDVFITKDSMEVNGKSIMGVMTLAANRGSKVKIRAEGNDAQSALSELVDLFKNKFGEE
ncbi:MAG: HPr family phosphocarrier protein [Candidatus Auribacterota bacterium]|jgi:phosphocarrier protein|nr:HPr family phosphocarrier protein [Candidatus Auribacterota bacterium]